jgi:hypothetical protein
MLFWAARFWPEARGPEDEDNERTWRSALRQDGQKPERVGATTISRTQIEDGNFQQ